MSDTPLSPCPGCRRHVRVDSDRCPFCACALSVEALPVAPDTGGARLTRAAIFAFATSVVACSTTRAPAPQAEQGTVAAVYGAPAPMTPPDAGPAAVTDVGAPAAQDAGAPAAQDAGAPVVADAGRPVRPRPTRPNVRPMVRYGAPPPPDDFV